MNIYMNIYIYIGGRLLLLAGPIILYIDSAASRSHVSGEQHVYSSPRSLLTCSAVTDGPACLYAGCGSVCTHALHVAGHAHVVCVCVCVCVCGERVGVAL